MIDTPQKTEELQGVPISFHDLSIQIERINGKFDHQSFVIAGLEKSFSRMEIKLEELTKSVSEYSGIMRLINWKTVSICLLVIVVFTLSQDKFVSQLLDKLL